MNQEIDNRIFSIGSFSRWKFGEEGRKGYYILHCNTEKNKYEQEYVENTMADSYTTISFGYDNKVFKSKEDMDESLLSVEKLTYNSLSSDSSTICLFALIPELSLSTSV